MTRTVGRESLGALVRESLVYGGGMVLARGLAFLLTPVLTRAFDARQFGVLDLLQTGTLLASLLLSLQMESAVLRYYSDEQDRGGLLSTYLFAQAGLSVVFLLVVWLAVDPIVRRHVDLEEGTLLLAAASVVGGLVYSHALTVLRAEREATRASALVLANTALNVLLVIGFVVGLRWGLSGVFAARGMSDGGCAAVFLWSRRNLYSLRFRWPMLVRFLKFGMPLTPEGLLAFAAAHAGKIFLLRYGSIADVGVLAVANRVATVVKLMLGAFRQAWLPYAYSIARSEQAERLYAAAFRGYARVTFVLCLGFAAFSPEATLLLAGDRYSGARSLLGLIGAGAVIAGLPYLFNIGLLLQERTGYYTVGVVVSSAVTIGFGWLLISGIGVLGAPIAGLLGSLTMAGVVLHFAQRVRPIPYDMKSLGLLAAAVCVIGAVAATEAVDAPLVLRVVIVAAACWWLLVDSASVDTARRWLLRRQA